MKEKDLNSFLASVRRTRFVDYLDPLGETAQNAFERRLSWARVSQHDPAYSDEARFLLDNAEDLRELLRRELEEDDWIEEADVGREWEARVPNRMNKMRENDRITEIFQPDDLEMGAAGQKNQKNQRSQPAANRKTSSSEGAEPRLSERGRTETPKPNQRAEPARSAQRQPTSGQSTSDETRKRDPAPNRSSARGSDAQAPGRTNRPLTSTAAPAAGNRGKTPLGQSRSPVAERARLPAGAGRSMDDGFAEIPARGHKINDEQTMRLGPNSAQDADLDDWDAPDDPVSSTGIMRIEDITAPPVQRDIALQNAGEINSSETVARPLLRGTPQPVLVRDDISTAPTAATRLRRPGDSGIGAIPRVRASVQEPPSRSRRPLLMMLGMSVVGFGALFLIGAVLTPVLYSKTNGFQDLTFGGMLTLAPPPEQAPVEPVVPTDVPTGEPSIDPQQPVPPSEPVPVELPTPPSEPVAVPSPPTEDKTKTAKIDKAKSEKADKAKAAKAEPEVVPEPQNVPTPVPESTARPINIEGLWVGSTSSSHSFKLTVLGQTDENFEGTVEISLEDGTFKSLAITGKVDSEGNVTFKGDSATFNGKVSARKATGSFTLGDKKENWTAYGGR